MAQAGYTPIQLYYSTTTTNVPTAGNLASGELAINITDGKLFYKDSGGVVRVIAGTGGTGTAEGGTATPISESMMSPLTVRAPAETGTRTLARTLGLPQADSALGAILGTSLTPAGEPILGEDESQRRAVWNIESLRNALGI